MLHTIWDQFLTIVKEEAGSRVVETWLKAVSLYQWDSLEQVVYLQAPNAFVKDWITANYLSLFTQHLSRLFHVDHLKVVFLDAKPEKASVAGEMQPTGSIIPAKVVPSNKKSSSKALVKHTSSRGQYQLNKQYLFDTFVKGPNNHMAYAAACAVTNKLGNLYNPLFIYGGSGLGKTHLLHAIAHEIKTHNQHIGVLYQPADRFVSEFINAIRFDKIHKFQAKYRSIDVFLVDDIQSISNKEQTQEAFFHIFNTLYDEQKQIVFSSDSYPADIDGLAERLRSRLAWGLVADIQTPSLETKIAIIKRKAEMHHEELSDEVANYIATYVISNVRELEGALIRVFAFSSLTKQPITLELTKKVLVRAQEPYDLHVSLDDVIKLVSMQYSYTLSDLRSKNRSKQLSLARQIAMYFMKKHTNKSFYEIALYLKRKDHSTVIHACRQIEHRIEDDPDFGKRVKSLECEIISH